MSKPSFTYIRNIIAEMKKVSWPTREETTRMTAIVLVVTAVIALALYGVDTGFQELVQAVLLD